MPLYAYRCTACGAQEEHLQKFTDDPVTECGTCGGPLRKLITGTSFALKGGGWYSDGYGSRSGASEGASASSGESAGSAGSAGSGESAGSSAGSGTAGTGDKKAATTTTTKPDKGGTKAAGE